jgi:hypothetical protein
MHSFVSRDALWAIAGNHEVDRGLRGSNARWAGTYETYRRLLGRKLYYYIILGNMCFIRMSSVSRNGRGVIPDEVVAWCRKVVEDHQWCSYIEISTHQPLGGSGLPNANTQGQLQSQRFTSWLGDPEHRVDAWFSGHTGTGFSSDNVLDHVIFQGCMFIATDNEAKTYVDHVAVDGSRSVVFRRWDREVKGRPTKQWGLDLRRSIETSDHVAFDGRYQDDGVFDIRAEPHWVMVQQPREQVDGQWRWPQNRPYIIQYLGLSDLANDNSDVGQGPAQAWLIPGAPSGFADGDGANNPLLNQAWGYGGLISCVRTGNGEFDWGARFDFSVGLPSPDPHGASGKAKVGKNTLEQLRRMFSLSSKGGAGYDSDGLEVWHWNKDGVSVARADKGGVGAGTANNFLRSGESQSFMAGNDENAHHRFFNNADSNDPVAAGAIISSGMNTAYLTVADASSMDDAGEISFEDARAVLDLVVLHEFRWKSTGRKDYGIFAQELFPIYPTAVTRGGWIDISTGLPTSDHAEGATYVPWMVDYSKLMTVLARCVQGLMAGQDEIRADIDALKKAI